MPIVFPLNLIVFQVEYATPNQQDYDGVLTRAHSSSGDSVGNSDGYIAVASSGSVAATSPTLPCAVVFIGKPDIFVPSWSRYVSPTQMHGPH